MPDSTMSSQSEQLKRWLEEPSYDQPWHGILIGSQPRHRQMIIIPEGEKGSNKATAGSEGDESKGKQGTIRRTAKPKDGDRIGSRKRHSVAINNGS